MDIFNIKKVKGLEARLCKAIGILDKSTEALDDYQTLVKTYQIKLELAEREVDRLRAENEKLSNEKSIPKLDINAYKMVGLIRDHAQRKYIKKELHYLIPASILKGIVNSIVEHE
jgi:exonuclease VII small subunit